MLSFTHVFCGVKLECEFDYEPAERTTDVDPGCPERAYLIEARVGRSYGQPNGVDIVDILSDEQREEIENAFLETKHD